MSDLTLASDFPQASEEEWLTRVAETLRGRLFDSLVSETLDGIRVKPLYRRATAIRSVAAPKRGEGETPWTIVQRVDMPDLGRANAQILEDLENGAGGLALVLPGSVTAGRHGVPISSLDDLKRLTEGVELDLISIRLDAAGNSRRMAGLLIELYDTRGLDLARCNVSLSLDPLGVFALTGHMSSESVLAPRLAAIVKDIAGRGHRGAALTADSRVYHGAGCSEAQELGAALATAVQYLRWLEAAEDDLADAVSRIGFLLAADADQFLTIAKIRAARLLCARAQAAMGLESVACPVHIETAMRMMSRRDPHGNLLRTTVAAFSAGVGGADEVTALPFTAALGLPDGFARRLARNIQTILQEESGIGRVADAGAGSGFVEAMTAELAGKAWEIFQSIEAHGGMFAAIASGYVQDLIADTAAKRRRSIAERRQRLTGISKFPNLEEGPVTVLDMVLPEGWRSDTSKAASSSEAEEIACPPLAQTRLAAPFETLRDAADAHAMRTGRPPAVFLASLGRLADFEARASWTRNLLAAGGIASLGDPGFVSGEAAGRAFETSGAKVACLCSSDRLYAELAADAARALRTAGAARVYVAGRPGERVAEFKAAGIDEFLFDGIDVIDALERLHQDLGIGKAESR